MPGTEVSAGTPRKRAVARSMPASNDTQALIEAITKASRDPAVDIDKMRFLLDTRRALLDEEAEQEWRDAMAAAQAEMSPIAKDLENPQTRSKYASLAALDAAIRPIYTAHGFAVTYDTEPWPEPNTLLIVCYIMRGRHSRRYQIPMPADGVGAKGGAVMTRTHATGSATSYGRRYLLCLGFNLVTSDDDGNRAGAFPRRAQPGGGEGDTAPPSSLAQRQLEAALKLITPKELAELNTLMGEAGVAITGAQAILDYFNVRRLEDLTHTQYEQAVNQLKAKIEEKKNAK